MKEANKFSKINPSKMLKTIFIVSAPLMAYLVWMSPAIADTTNTVDSIAEKLLAAEAQFTDLRLEYVAMVRVHTKDNSNPFRVVEGIYVKKKMLKELQYSDRRISMIDSETKQSTLIVDALASFNGDVTITLNRKVKSGKPMRGGIYPGYKPDEFPPIDADPHTSIWYFGPKQVGELLKKNSNTFRIESESEVIEGVSTIKLAGTILDGIFTMKLWVSPEFNFLPMKRQVFRTSDGKLGAEMVLSNLVQLPNGLWYPKTIRTGSPDPEFAFTYSISKISIDPIPEEFFSPEFPSNTRVEDKVLNVSYTIR